MSSRSKAGFDVHPENINKSGDPGDAWTWASLYKRFANELDENGTPYKVKIARKMLQQAAKGDVTAVREISNRTDGMPKQTVDINDPQKEIAEMKDYVSKRLQTMGGTIPQEQVGDTVSVDRRSG
jgi:hypothetical protein